MIKVENWSDEEIKSYGRLIGEAFAASPGIAEKVPSEYIMLHEEVISTCI